MQSLICARFAQKSGGRLCRFCECCENCQNALISSSTNIRLSSKRAAQMNLVTCVFYHFEATPVKQSKMMSAILPNDVCCGIITLQSGPVAQR